MWNAVLLQAQTVREVFISLPEPILLDLSTNDRMDLIDLYDVGQKAVVLNSLGDSLTIEILTDNYLLLKKGNSSLQIAVLTMINESKLYFLIHTACAPVCDSQIGFYSVNWTKLDSEIFISPITNEGLDISLMQFTFNPETQTLQQKNNTHKLLSLEDQEKIKASIKEEEKEYQWNGIRFSF